MSRKKFNLLEERVLNILEYNKFPKPEREFRFHPKRLWRFDFAYPNEKIAIEIEGGVFVRGRHTTGIGFTADTEKYNEAIKLGWRVLRYTIKNIYSIPSDLIALGI